MSLSNLPPGVTESMIPGNTPEDAAWEDMIEKLCDTGLPPEEILRRVNSPYWIRGKKKSRRFWP